MQHDDIRHKLSEYIDGSVTLQERSAIEEHLRTCATCADALTELRRTIEHIRAVEEIEPPAWLSQKIMATVRAETENKKGFFTKFFFPLHVKLPIQAIAVLFLAVSAYYIDQNIRPASEITETPLHEFADRAETPLIGAEKDAPGKTDAPLLRSNKVPQSPEYKALDMKLGYEKAAPPLIDDRAAAPSDAAAKPAEGSAPVKNGPALKKRSDALQAGKPAIMQEQTAPAVDKERATGAVQESLAPQQKLKTAVAEDEAIPAITYVVSVKDLETAARDMELTIRNLGGTILKMEPLEAKRIFTTTLSAERLSELYRKLKLIGDVTERATALEPRQDRMTFKIELVLLSTPQ